ncbi:hypothetical protein [Streptantibioticus cattleyicolor]|uniref:Uncharacterized protein n=1 Tax=Streptantibioticus cattleyicolor (strain ATCC 35852 / DSM 46488 / JCM 4925 / NBRC 14057 / NRRL 8057) TaxID=1003195 RepID=F8JN19_STREN|nr:hypothetical protein [Streptantibioticus cattleyicolor]AEW98255.1 hypothetical protein SCATT_p00620 [Streptantibioticus cattleyicolor NRRL 8057 = DSM 46488]CCB72682.1 exported protein of unknown function [Streptantibioticus cattleyicolor NRRL 8057 = DSM 46488]
MNGKLATTTLAAVAATLLSGVALAAPASAATAAPVRAVVTADSSTYYVYVTGVSGSLDGARANAGSKLPHGCYSEVVASGTTPDNNIWVAVQGTCSGAR